jgi:hypothetical protein
MNISNQVSVLETDNEALRATNREMERRITLLDFEVEQLRRRCAKSDMERDEALEICSQLKIIVEQAGAALIHGMNRINAAKRNREFDEHIDEEPPLFLQGGHTANGHDTH